MKNAVQMLKEKEAELKKKEAGKAKCPICGVEVDI